jgi:hypothetical protein
MQEQYGVRGRLACRNERQLRAAGETKALSVRWLHGAIHPASETAGWIQM